MVIPQFMIYSWVLKKIITKCTGENSIGKETILLYKVYSPKKENFDILLFQKLSFKAASIPVISMKSLLE